MSMDTAQAKPSLRDLYLENWRPKGVKKAWESTGIDSASASRFIGDYADGKIVDAIAWFDERDHLRCLVADTENGQRITYKNKARNWVLSFETLAPASPEGCGLPTSSKEGL